MSRNYLSRLFVTVSLCVVALYAQPVVAWGALGHQAICDASWRLSSSAIQQKLGAAAKRMGYATFAESCVWADHIRQQPEFDWLAPLHYVNVAKSAQSVRGAACLQTRSVQPSCILNAIPFFARRSLELELSQRQRDEALLLLGHFVGDLHQPLHVAYREDRGGTRRTVIFAGRSLSLHELWDGDILSCAHRGSWRRLGRSIAAEAGGIVAEPMVEVIPWADESLQLTRDIYRNLNRTLPDDYCQRYHPIARRQLALAALRLSDLLAR